MAPLSKILPWTAILASLTIAIPLAHHPRDVYIVTEVDWVTIDSTVTVYQDQPTQGPGQLVELPAGPTTSLDNTQPSPTPAHVPDQYDQVDSTSSSTQPPSSVPPSQAAPVPTTSTTAPPPPPPQPTTFSTSTSISTSVAPPPASTVSNPPAPSSPSGSKSGYSGQCSHGSPCSGDGTYYDVSTSPTNPSFCDTTNNGLSENVLALPVAIMDQSHCGKTVTISYNGNTVTGTVVDKCMGCKPGDVDLSRCYFTQLAGSLDAGRLHDLQWWIN